MTIGGFGTDKSAPYEISLQFQFVAVCPKTFLLTNPGVFGYNREDIFIRKAVKRRVPGRRPVREPDLVGAGTVCAGEHGLGAEPSIGRRFRIAPVTAF